MPIARNQVTPVTAASETGDHIAGPAGWPRWVTVGLWTALVLALLAHLYGLYMPGEPGASEWFPNSDKLLHFLGFGIPATLAVLLVRHWWPLVAFAAHAVISEIAQSLFLPSRDGDVWDVVADLTGVGVASLVWWLQRRASATAGSNPTNRTSAAARRPNA